ncbi:MAG: nucleoside hydrolase [Gemmataceae bacterium]|nr:nucleoside hydrolase [Gemmataceae bacterium]
MNGATLSLRAAMLCVLLLPALAPAAEPEKDKAPVILDLDIGTDIDDTFALALALASPELDLRGITTVSGDTKTRAIMCCRFLTAAGRRNVPVAIGAADKPLQELRGMQWQYAAHPAAIYNRTSKPVKESAVEFLYSQLKAEPGKLTIIAVGPLTNIAQLLTEHPDCKPWIKRLVIMGGAVRVGYNAKAPAEAEFNIKTDPKAAKVVFTSGVPLTVAPLDATTMLKLDAKMLERIFANRSLLNMQVESLFQLWDQKDAPIMFDPVAVTLAFDERFCKMEDLFLEVDDKGFTREGKGKPNARVATSIQKDEYLRWFVDRLATTMPKAPAPRKTGNLSSLIPRTGLPNRVHAFEDFETDHEKRWWMSGKAETANVPSDSTRACRGVLTQDFDDLQGDLATMYTAVIFNPVPGPPMGKNPRLSFRYWLKGTDTLRVQIYSLSKGYHRYLTVTKLPQEKWEWGTVDMTAARRPDGTGGPLSEEERIDDIQFYVEPTAELLVDDIVLYDAATPEQKRPYPNRVLYTGLFDTGAGPKDRSKHWPGEFEIAPKKGSFWNAAKSVENGKLEVPWIQLGLKGERPIGATTQLFFRYRLEGADTIKVVLVNRTRKESHVVELKALEKGEWAEVVADFSADAKVKPKKGDRVDEIQFLLPKGADLLIDDVLLYEPAP